MAKFKPYNYSQMVMIPVSLKDQLIEGTLERCINDVVENKIDLSVFNSKYNNDDTGCPAYDPKLLLKVVLFAYSRGIIGSRRIERACEENIVFKALSCGMVPDHSTIAHFISSLKAEIIHLFRDVLLYCEELDLLGGSHFSLDGCKLPSNASRQWSGTFKELSHKRNKLEDKVRSLVSEHERSDKASCESERQEKEDRIRQISKKIERIDRFLQENRPKTGKTKKEIQSNVTDNESAKMPTSHGVIQGYNAQSFVDDKHQVIIHAEAMGNGQDADNLRPMLEGAKGNMQCIGMGADYLEGKILSADSNYHNNANIKHCLEEKVDAYIPDTGFRKRDERYSNQSRFKDGVNKPPRKQSETSKKEMFSWQEFEYETETGKYRCPAGKYLDLQSRKHRLRKKYYRYYRSRERDCKTCSLGSKCLYKEDSKSRGLLIPLGYSEKAEKEYTCSQMMRQKIDTEHGKEIYSRRLGIIEPVFANIRTQKQLNRFTLRGKVKVNIQWMLYCMVHNIEKIANYGLT